MTQNSINSSGEIVLYEAPGVEIRLDVRGVRLALLLFRVVKGSDMPKGVVAPVLRDGRGLKPARWTLYRPGHLYLRMATKGCGTVQVDEEPG
jgi:hypothetical protein